jgi:WD40 repeat protein
MVIAIVALTAAVAAAFASTRFWVEKRIADRRIADAHPGGVLAVALLGDSVVVTSGVDGTAAEWELSSGRMRRRFEGPTFRFQDIALSADGRLALTPTRDGDAAIWEPATGTIVRRIGGANGGASLVAMAPRSGFAAVATLDRAITVWRLESGDSIASVRPHSGRIVGLAFAGDDVMSAGDEETICVQPTMRSGSARCFPAVADGITRAAFNAEGTVIATGNRTGEIRLWGPSGSPLRTLNHEGEVTSLAFDRTGEVLASGSSDGSARLWRVASGEELGRMAPAGGYVSSIAVSREGRVAVAGTGNGELVIWHPRR